jgi:hypothetical protein
MQRDNYERFVVKITYTNNEGFVALTSAKDGDVGTLVAMDEAYAMSRAQAEKIRAAYNLKNTPEKIPTPCPQPRAEVLPRYSAMLLAPAA